MIFAVLGTYKQRQNIERVTFAVLGGFKQKQNMALFFIYFFFSELCVDDFCGRGYICRTAEYHFRFFLLLFVVEEPINVCLSGYFSWRHSAKKKKKKKEEEKNVLLHVSFFFFFFHLLC